MCENVIEAKSPLGYTVTCSRSRWEEHIIPVRSSGGSHDNMEGNEKAVKIAIESPYFVYESNRGSGFHVYFGEHLRKTNKNMFTKVVVYNGDEKHTVVTAHSQEGISGVNEGD